MAQINEHYLKLAGAYLFPEIARRVNAYIAEHPASADEIIRCEECMTCFATIGSGKPMGCKVNRNLPGSRH